MNSPIKAVFLDKDGTLIHNIPYNTDPEKVTLMDGAVKALKEIALHNYKFVLVTNQQGIAHGKITEQQLELLMVRLKLLLLKHNIELLNYYYCPHDLTGSIPEYANWCECKKPLPGLLIKAAKELNIDLGKSWMIGDILHDIEAGNRAGCRTILLDVGNETEWVTDEYRNPDFTVKSWNEVSEIVDA